MNRRDFLKTAGAGAAAFLLPGCLNISNSPAADAKKPNVLLILTDDQGWGDIHSHDNQLIDTPVMDKIAADGARFDRFFVSPVCSPTRASILTGRYHLRSGVHGVTRAYENMRAGEITIAEVLKREGYVTGCFGKWHNGAYYPYHPNFQGFDEFYGFCAGHWNNYFDTKLEHNGKEIATKGYITDCLTDAAIDFIETNKNRPFFCYLPYNAPHSPFQVPDKYFDKYKSRGIEDQLACTYAMCENIDDNVGRILTRLDELKLTDDTIVIFLTDNGPNTRRFNGDMRGNKGSVHEGGVRVPLFIRWPGRIAPGANIKQIAGHIDLLSTIADLCGIDNPDTLPLDGVSLVPLLDGKTADWPERLIFTFLFPEAGDALVPGSVRSQRWRAVYEKQAWSLFDMAGDPSQKTDVAEKYPDTLKELSDAYGKKCEEVIKDGFDPLPAHLGHPDWPVVVLPGPEAFLVTVDGGGISYGQRNGWANDWITNWTNTAAYAWWPLEVIRPVTCEVTLLYTCSKENLGAKAAVQIQDKTLEATVTEEHDPAPVPSPTRGAIRYEVPEKIWKPLTIGTVKLEKGPAKVTVRALQIPGKQMFDIKAVRLRTLD